ncbi:MAG: DUF423 domain-containing protein [Chitinophagaceae bacterium]
MAKWVLIVACLYGITGVVLGAFGAHLFKKIISREKLESFETGVRYQLVHAVVLLVMGFMFDFSQTSQQLAAYLLAIGVVMFSFSIYFLSFSEQLGNKVKLLGPVTPLGGLLIVLGWASLLVYFVQAY